MTYPIHSAQPSRRGVRTVLALTAGFVVLVGAVVGALKLTDAPSALVAQHCVATTDTGTAELDIDQTATAALIAAIAEQRGLPARAVTIALATALQESTLRNLDYGDRDSLGIFQQRPSQGWGSIEEVTNPVYATNKFYEELVKVTGYETMAVTEAAQAVQRSAYPDAYAKHETRARQFASALTGYSPASLTCILNPATAAGTVDGLIQRARADLGSVVGGLERQETNSGPGTLLITADGDRLAWVVAEWAVAVASDEKVTAVALTGWRWDRGKAAWAADDAAGLTSGQVLVTLASG